MNTGKMAENTELEGQPTPDLKLNDYVVYDEAQVKMRYMVDCEVVI